MDCDAAGSKQEKCDEISNEMKNMSIKNCGRIGHQAKDFIEENTHNPPKHWSESDRVGWGWNEIVTTESLNSASSRAGV